MTRKKLTRPHAIGERSPKTFFVVHPVDMYFKLLWEMKNAHHSERSSARETAYFALNAAMTAWHMVEWIGLTLQPEQYARLQEAGFDVSDVDSLKEHAKAQRSMAMIEQIAVTAKHYQGYKRPLEATTFSVWLDPQNGSEKIWVPMVKDGESSVPLSIALGFAVSYWRDVLVISGMATQKELEQKPPNISDDL